MAACRFLLHPASLLCFLIVLMLNLDYNISTVSGNVLLEIKKFTSGDGIPLDDNDPEVAGMKNEMNAL